MIGYIKRKEARKIMGLIEKEIKDLNSKRNRLPNFHTSYQHKIIALSDMRETIAANYKIETDAN
ncbi:MAG: hypothetical protein HC896_00225 [Bacteroidales bacterium]|nr:hypothetical protein [Bacteroidales bacterium]